MRDAKLVKSYITDDKGNIESVILDYKTFKNIEEILLDIGLGKAMKEVAEDEEVDLEEAVRIAGFKK
ncbi:MAG: antitoxin [Ignavibacteriales bacterium]